MPKLMDGSTVGDTPRCVLDRLGDVLEINVCNNLNDPTPIMMTGGATPVLIAAFLTQWDQC